MMSLLWCVGCFWAEPEVPTRVVPPQAPGRVRTLNEPGPLSPFDATQPNVVVLFGCTVRRDQVSSYGGPPGVTPTLDKMAAEGVRIADPISAASWTRAATAAMVTGYHPLELGLVVPNVRRNNRALDESIVTAAEHFESAGYRTVGGTTNPNLNAVFGFAQGFQTYVEPARLWREDRTKLDAEDLLPGVFDATGSAQERPLYLQLMFVDAHAPFLVPDPDAFAAPGVPQEVQLYRAALHQLDHQIGLLFEGLEQRGYTNDNTVFVVMSDHGEGLQYPAHHGISHGRYLYSSSVQAIWQLRGRGVPVGGVVEGVTSQIDLLPTLLGLAGIPGELPGVDLTGAIQTGGESPRSTAIADSWFRGSNRAAVYSSSTSCMRSFKPAGEAEPKAPTGRFVPGCYDRIADPLQHQPLPAEDQALMAELAQWRAERPLSTRGEPVEVSEELNGQLEALGYTAD